jgi:predicted ATP-grasp superfamily ATP-dependent carboligase
MGQIDGEPIMKGLLTREQPILLAGISVRMLAELAVRAGYQVVALDYFGDADLQSLCPSRSLLRDYGSTYSAATLVDAASAISTPCVMYSASLENHPAEVARLANGRRLLGNSPVTLQQTRDPVRLADTLRSGGFVAPRTFTSAPGITLDPDRRWLHKPIQSGGGHGVHAWRGGELPATGVLQERLPGMVCSAAFVANGKHAVLLGISEQLVGRRAFGATGFRYCGNLVPPRLSPSELQSLVGELRALINHLTETFGLRGLNGIDFIWHDHRPWTIEVNPRPTASLELIDMAYGVRVFDAHVRSFAGELPSFDLEAMLANNYAAGKAIIYAPDDVLLPDTGTWHAFGIRDIPHPGEKIKRGHPVCTILTKSAAPEACMRKLREQADELRTELKQAQAVLA